jgi:DNA invertase Pin-like site-specific DNA recombinase
MEIGSARVSTGKQTLGLQKDAQASAGCERVFEDFSLDRRNCDQGSTRPLM